MFTISWENLICYQLRSSINQDPLSLTKMSARSPAVTTFPFVVEKAPNMHCVPLWEKWEHGEELFRQRAKQIDLLATLSTVLWKVKAHSSKVNLSLCTRMYNDLLIWPATLPMERQKTNTPCQPCMAMLPWKKTSIFAGKRPKKVNISEYHTLIVGQTDKHGSVAFGTSVWRMITRY